MVTRAAFAALWLVAAVCFAVSVPAPAAADTPVYACDYPFVGDGGGGFGGSGSYCDGMTEVNGSHWHCWRGRFSLGDLIGGIGIGSGMLNPGVGIGAERYPCEFECPDGTKAKPPNPPGLWKQYLRVEHDDCADHHVDAPQQYDQTQDQPPPAPGEGGPQPGVTTPVPTNPEQQTNPQR